MNVLDVLYGFLFYYLTEKDSRKVEEQDERIMRLEQELNALQQRQEENQETQETANKQIGFV